MESSLFPKERELVATTTKDLLASGEIEIFDSDSLLDATDKVIDHVA